MRSILINPNVATIQTDTRFADKVYLLPVTPQYVESVIEQERPDAIMLSYGGQTALNCGVNLFNDGVLEKYGVRVLGTHISGIQMTEDRQQFKDAMIRCGVPVLPSKTVTRFQDAKIVAESLGYPVIVRVAYTLGGKGGGVARNELELHEIVERGIKASMVGQVLIEEYIGEWKQIEYEIMRDAPGNGVIVCNMENVLAMKAHTGDNIVVAPSQTINNCEYHMLRSAGLRAANHIGIIGECNIQFALDPHSEKYVAIEVNPRLSRSSALASKATGYPLAYMSAKIGLGYHLHELTNTITKSTTACFEPSLDYIVCKHPRWDFAKFDHVERRLGPTMKSVGEVMGVGQTFEEAIQKAVRMLDVGADGLVLNRNQVQEYTEEDLENGLSKFDDRVLYYVCAAIMHGFDTGRISQLSSIDPWFVERIRHIVGIASRLERERDPDRTLMREAKQAGFSDVQIGRAISKDQTHVRNLRKSMGIRPYIKQIDSLAAEWPAATNYLYATYGGADHDVAVPDKRAVMVIGAGPYRIGSSVEFDWGTVNMVWGIRAHDNTPVSVVNCNPETVSTDYDICDRLYFEELTYERIMDIVEFENPSGVVTCVGGQAANNLTPSLGASGVTILGTAAQDVDRAEDRSKFSSEMDKLHIRQPPWQAFSRLHEARIFAQKVGFPVLVRPSYVLSGAAMKVVWSGEDLRTYTQHATSISPDHPVVISKFMMNSLEVDVDGVSDGHNVIIGAIVEHIDSAGVHSGDAMMCIPPWRLSNKIIHTITEYATKIARTFNIRGPFNLQFLIHDELVYVIELNIRASRSMPFVSKLVRMNLISLASKVIMGGYLSDIPVEKWRSLDSFGIKVPQFSFMQLEGADLTLGVEMHSTGEAACFGNSFYDALCKGLVAVGYTLPASGTALVTAGGIANKEKLLPSMAKLHSMGFNLLATEHTAEFFEEKLGAIKVVHKISEPERKPNIADLLYMGKIDFIINIPGTTTLEKYVGMLEDEYLIRRKALELGIPVLTTVEMADAFVNTLEWMRNHDTTKDPIKPYDI